jgi:hypothetical protein
MEFDCVDVSVSKKQGNVGVSRAVYEYTKRGYTVLFPLSDSDKYDMVIDDGESLKRVQVKTSRCHAAGGKYDKTGYQVNLATKGGNAKINTSRSRNDGDYDVLFVLVETGECWSIPVTALTARTAIVVGATGRGAKYDEFRM